MARRQDKLFVEPTTRRGDLAPGGEPALYLEYVEELGKVPTLTLGDEVVSFPRPSLPADFRQGQRPNARKEARDDPYALREERTGDLDLLYAEYAGGGSATTQKKKRKRAGAKGDSATRAPARKRGPTRRKRSKS